MIESHLHEDDDGAYWYLALLRASILNHRLAFAPFVTILSVIATARKAS